MEVNEHNGDFWGKNENDKNLNRHFKTFVSK